MKRYHDLRDERIRVRRQKWVYDHWYSGTWYPWNTRDWEDDKAERHALGKYRKRHPADCGKSNCMCNWDKRYGPDHRYAKQRDDLRDQLGEARLRSKNKKNGKAARCPHNHWEQVLRGWPSTYSSGHFHYRCFGCGKQEYSRPARGRVKESNLIIVKSNKMMEWEMEQARRRKLELEQRPKVLKAWNNLW